MKNKLTLMSFIFLLILSGCSIQPHKKINNDLFSDIFFSDIIEICDLGSNPVTAEQMEPVIIYLQSLELTESNEHLSNINAEGEQTLGLGLLTFRKYDGTEIVFIRNHEKITCIEGLNTCSFLIEEGNLNSGLKEAFNQALNIQ